MMIKAEEISQTEAELYDRQIRLWGLDAQKRLKASKILLITVNGLGAEVAKNIILAGVNSFTLCDDKEVTAADRTSQFLVPAEAAGKNRADASLKRATKLNPTVKFIVEKRSVDDLPDNVIIGHTLVCAIGCTLEQLYRLNDLCRANDVKFFCGDVFGMFGFSFADLKNHTFVEEVTTTGAPKRDHTGKLKKQEPVTKTVEGKIEFVPLKSALNVDWSTEENRKRLKRQDPTYFLVLSLLQFRTKFKRDPNPAARSDDIKELKKIREEIRTKYNLPEDKFPLEYLESVFGSVSPACAIVGGVIGQEIIKAIGGKDAPDNNIFLFNPIKCTGTVARFES